jgi:hypothetical protein
MMVRVDVHEQLGAKEAADLVTAVKKVARYYRKYERCEVTPAAHIDSAAGVS